MPRYKRYTKEAEEYLTVYWGSHRPWQVVSAINRMTGDTKTFRDVTVKARSMGLGGIKEAYNLITIKDVSKALHHNNQGRLKKWGIPCYRFDKWCKYYYVDVKAFWKWAYENRDKINFRKYEIGTLLPEPKWLEQEIKEQIKHKKKEDYHYWTEQEEAALKLYKSHGKTNAYIAKKLGISERQVYHKIRYLKKNKATDLTKYDKQNTVLTEEQKEKTIALRAEGYSYRAIGKAIDGDYSTIRRFYMKAQERGEI